MIKRIFILCITLGYLNPVAAFELTETIYVPYVCDSDIKESKESKECSDISDATLVARTKAMLSTTKTKECLLDPNDITCDVDIQVAGTAIYTIYFVRTGSVEKKEIKVSQWALGTSVKNIELTAQDLKYAQKSKEANELYLNIKKSLHLTENSSGDMVDEGGEIPKNTDGSLMNGFGNCGTALAYATNDRSDSRSPSCQSFLNSWIINEWRKTESPMSNFSGLIKSLTEDMPGFSYNIDDSKFDFVIRYDDNSLLSMTIILPINSDGAPSIILNRDASRTSANVTLTEFFAQSSGPNNGVSYNELVAYLGAEGIRDNCSTHIQTIGREVTYLVTKTVFPDGLKKFSISMLNNPPTTKTVVTCSNLPLN